MELAKEVTAYGEKLEGLEQYAVQRFATALHVVPKMLAENTGVKANVVIAELAAAHAEGKAHAGEKIQTYLKLSKSVKTCPNLSKSSICMSIFFFIVQR